VKAETGLSTLLTRARNFQVWWEEGTTKRTTSSRWKTDRKAADGSKALRQSTLDIAAEDQ
jgi:hypothetical protein